MTQEQMQARQDWNDKLRNFKNAWSELVEAWENLDDPEVEGYPKHWHSFDEELAEFYNVELKPVKEDTK